MSNYLKKNKRVRRYERSFSEDTRWLFYDCHECWECGRNGWDALHHINGGEFDEADSPLNAAPVHNITCHIGKSFSDEDKSRQLKKTLDFLEKSGYALNDKDNRYLEKFKKYYV